MFQFNTPVSLFNSFDDGIIMIRILRNDAIQIHLLTYLQHFFF